METATLNSEIRLVAIDETRHWAEAIQKACGKIKTVYMYDTSVATNLCEITPSYELTPLYYVTENEISDRVFDIMSGEDMEPMYMHCNVVDALDSIASEQELEFESSESDEYKEHFEEVKGYLNCNHLI